MCTFMLRGNFMRWQRRLPVRLLQQVWQLDAARGNDKGHLDENWMGAQQRPVASLYHDLQSEVLEDPIDLECVPRFVYRFDDHV